MQNSAIQNNSTILLTYEEIFTVVTLKHPENYQLHATVATVSGCCCFSDISISLGSVATHLRCGGIFYYCFTTNFVLVCWWRNFENWSAFGKVRGKNRVVPFPGHGVVAACFIMVCEIPGSYLTVSSCVYHDSQTPARSAHSFAVGHTVVLQTSLRLCKSHILSLTKIWSWSCISGLLLGIHVFLSGLSMKMYMKLLFLYCLHL